MDHHPNSLAAILAKQLPPNDPVDLLKPADMGYWAKMPTWTNSEGIALIFGKDPTVFSAVWARSVRQISTKAAQFDDYMEMARRAVEIKQLLDVNIPNFFLDWAVGRIEGATQLAGIVQAAGLETVDWRLAYVGLKGELDAVKAELDHRAEERSEGASMASAPEYSPAFITFMLRGVRELGLSETDITKKEQVEAWIRANWDAAQWGTLSTKRAETMATMMRRPEQTSGGNQPLSASRKGKRLSPQT